MTRLNTFVNDKVERTLITLLHNLRVRNDDYMSIPLTGTTIIHLAGSFERQERVDQIVYRSLLSGTQTNGNWIQHVLLHVQETQQLLKILKVFLLLATTFHHTTA